MAYSYSEHTCPEVDECAADLRACKDTVTIGNDQQDCVNPLVMNCFTTADACVAAAAKKCEGDLISEADWLLDLFAQCPSS